MLGHIRHSEHQLLIRLRTSEKKRGKTIEQHGSAGWRWFGHICSWEHIPPGLKRNTTTKPDAIMIRDAWTMWPTSRQNTPNNQRERRKANGQLTNNASGLGTKNSVSFSRACTYVGPITTPHHDNTEDLQLKTERLNVQFKVLTFGISSLSVTLALHPALLSQ